MSKTQLLTILGCVLAALTAVSDFLLHTNMEGGAFQQPTFWLMLIGAAILGVKGYMQQGTPPTGEVVVTKPAPPVA